MKNKCIEFRDDFETKCYLVDEDTERCGFQRVPLSQGYDEYGSGCKLFYFEAAGRYAPAVLDIIYANDIEEARILVNNKYKERFKRNTIIPKPIRELIDEETMN
ncbi:hypothetical protein DW954_02320 [Clostridium sp. AM45-5]|nr:hypothetical protein [Clostridium sp. AM45-5]RHS68192.1 hypothetical protein DW954_02320 [Clostridium sp. AM45-5]